MRTEAQKKASRKYDVKNYKIISCRIKIQDIDKYIEYATKYGVSMNGAFTSCINYCINNNIDISGSIKLNQSEADTILNIQNDTADTDDK